MTLNYLKSLVLKAAKENGIEPGQVTISQLTEQDPQVTLWTIRKFGGLSNIKSSFPESKELVPIYDQKELKKHIRELEKKATAYEVTEEILKQISEKVKPIKPAPKFDIVRKTMKGRERHVVAMLNDTHYGLNVRPEEVSGVNEYNWTISARRTAMMVREIISFKIDKRDQVECLHFILNGDLIAGIIHGLMTEDIELLTYQFNGALHILSSAVEQVSKAYPKVKVYFSTGNHGDHPHRREGGRVIAQTYDSIEGMLFYALSVAFKNHKDIEFIASKGLYQDIYLPAGRAIATHGHILFSKQLGNPGSSINTRGLSDAIMRFNAGETERKKKRVELILLGHTHSNVSFTTNDGVRIYNAPSMSGIDSYAHSLGLNHNLIGQILFESTPTHLFGDSRLVMLQEADKDKELDKIISPYEKTLVSK